MIFNVGGFHWLSPSRRSYLRSVVEDHYLSVEVNPIFHEFIVFMRRTYGIKADRKSVV